MFFKLPIEHKKGLLFKKDSEKSIDMLKEKFEMKI